jgi:hypothetical protein
LYSIKLECFSPLATSTIVYLHQNSLCSFPEWGQHNKKIMVIVTLYCIKLECLPLSYYFHSSLFTDKTCPLLDLQRIGYYLYLSKLACLSLPAMSTLVKYLKVFNGIMQVAKHNNFQNCLNLCQRLTFIIKICLRYFSPLFFTTVDSGDPIRTRCFRIMRPLLYHWATTTDRIILESITILKTIVLNWLKSSDKVRTFYHISETI